MILAMQLTSALCPMGAVSVMLGITIPMVHRLVCPVTLHAGPVREEDLVPALLAMLPVIVP